MFGGYVFPFFAAVYYWFPLMTGRMYSERLGKAHFWMMLIGFYFQSLFQMQTGLVGMRRRIADYDPGLGIDMQQMIVSIAGFAVGASILIFMYNMYVSVKRGEVAVPNPWRSRSPEWQIPMPVKDHNYDEPFVVTGEPYDYGLEGSEYTSLSGGTIPSQAVPEAAPAD
jgi:cytochrome c oxidase subunit 1